MIQKHLGPLASGKAEKRLKAVFRQGSLSGSWARGAALFFPSDPVILSCRRRGPGLIL
ncbi:MAG: hypothetical protein OEZ28_09665 [Nitrospinota bacterium]|nr:hypothetical protein [Nitrospinota bacterium]